MWNKIVFFCLIDILNYTTERDVSIHRHGMVYASHLYTSTDLPSGIPDHIFYFLSEYGLEKCGNNYI